MSVVTRSKSAAALRDIVHHLPDCLWLEIFSNLPEKEIGRLPAVCSHFRAIAPDVWREACAKRWPEWFAVSRAPSGAQWRRHYEMFQLRQRDLELHLATPPTINKTQSVVTAVHRTILTEWLAEVCHTWDLDSTLLFKAVGYLDHYLSKHNVAHLGRFQLYGLASLRAALGAAGSRSQTAQQDDLSKQLDPQRFAQISDKTYSPDEVEQATAEVQEAIPHELQVAPCAKLFLRSFWYRLAASKHIDNGRMHVYTLASFLLQLSLLDLSCTGFPACSLAAAALSLALAFFKEDAWPQLLQHYTALMQEDLQPVKTAICKAQASQDVSAFRLIWHFSEGEPGNKTYAEYSTEWQQVIALMSQRGELICS
ncbi:hypothetical protein WJX73_010078 [Symbiochloris irregularis]|uniref:Cyclin-F n=1 Tax=Symbiochloris irregularis TaxID=706552 RepID=A0AAW1PLW7_9CHLO